MAQETARSTVVFFVSHVLDENMLRVFDRLTREAPADHDVLFLLNSDAPLPEAGALLGSRLVRTCDEELLQLGYPAKCRRQGWDIQGNADLIFLQAQRRRPDYERYWFIEYDVHWEGRWDVLFEHFRGSDADVLATIVCPIDEVSHAIGVLVEPPLVFPEGLGWGASQLVRAFLPLCRLSRAALDAMDAAYRGGLAGHYEFLVATTAAQAGLVLEDIGGQGRYVRPENENRFYFAAKGRYTLSPGTFVFRPSPTVLPRPNTLWHPIKPAGVPLMHPMRVHGSLAKNLLETIKPWLWQLAIRLWFATRWRPLRTLR